MTRIERAIAERELLRARRMLKDLIDVYRSGHWQHYYKTGTFVHEVKRARQAADYWAEICHRRVRA